MLRGIGKKGELTCQEEMEQARWVVAVEAAEAQEEDLVRPMNVCAPNVGRKLSIHAECLVLSSSAPSVVHPW